MRSRLQRRIPYAGAIAAGTSAAVLQPVFLLGGLAAGGALA
jgi:hypothetical protein